MKSLGLFLFLITSTAHAELHTEIAIDGVSVAKSNAPGTSGSGYQTCGAFKGSIQNNDVWVSPKTTGGSGHYEHTLVWRMGAGYQDYVAGDQQFEVQIKDGYRYPVRLPTLRDDVAFVQQALLLITRDTETGKQASAERIFTVSRQVMLTPTRDVKIADQDCYERMPAFESTVGVLSNGSTNSSNLLIKQGVERLWSSTSGSSWGFYISPFSLVSINGMSLGNLFSVNRSYFKGLSKQTTETVEVSTDYQLTPGDYMQIYTQKTRYVNHYDAIVLDACGERSTFPGAYMMQWWGFAYHAIPINPFDPHRPNPNNIGAKPINTCPAELSGTGDGGSSYPFFQTNL